MEYFDGLIYVIAIIMRLFESIYAMRIKNHIFLCLYVCSCLDLIKQYCKLKISYFYIACKL